ncbi:MAG TPA: AMP-binding protein [Thermoanaerobaculia bacterium]|nr:AMP-binding protein [Thermoanaerobaculia bacterium]
MIELDRDPRTGVSVDPGLGTAGAPDADPAIGRAATPGASSRPRRSATLIDLLERSADRDDRGLRLLDRHERERFLSWRRVAAGAERTGAALAALGVRPGDRVALVFPTGEEFFDAFFGALAAGAVPVPLYPPVRLGRLGEYHRATAGMLRAAGARVVLADARIRRLLGQAVAAARPELGCLTLDGLAGAAGRLRPREPHRPAPGDLALVQFSSGTTVDPKPVALSHRAILAQVEMLNGLWPERERIVHSGASWLPLYHDMGLIGCIFPALELGTDMTLLPPEVFVARPATWLRAISRFRATVSPAPNFAYGLCVAKVRDEELDGVDLSSWRIALNGAEAVSARTLRSFIERFRPWGFRPEAMTPVYGLAEAALAVTFSDLGRPFRSGRFERASLEPGEAPCPDPGGRELVSVGRPVPGFEVEVRDGDAGRVGHVGRVWVRGPSLMEGYLGRLRETARVLRDGWLDTGDLGFLSGGELFLTGRAKDLVILRGRNYGPEEIEAAAAAVPGARAGCAVAASYLPEESDGEELVVFVEAARDASDGLRERLPAAVREAVLGALGLRPDRVEVLAPGTLPRTSSGKLRRGETLRRWLAGELAPPEPVTPLRLARAMAGSAWGYLRSGVRSEVDPADSTGSTGSGRPEKA